MQDLHMNEVAITGQALGNGRSSFLDPVDIFKKKLCAAATRDKFQDSADLQWLETRYGAQIQEGIEIGLRWSCDEKIPRAYQSLCQNRS